MPTPDIVVLFSGGLDSILAARLLAAQGINIRCLHFVTPFFGSAESVPNWREAYGLDIESRDIGREFAAMLCARPAYGFGKVMNPCVDCKILLLRHAHAYMRKVGAKALATGAVLGQRPMSQRRDTLQAIQRDAGVAGLLLRPLSARLLPKTEVEASGLVDRERLLAIHGRGRTGQLLLAREFGLREIPTPAGGCRLDERENARRYWSVLTRLDAPTVKDFALANCGRQFWRRFDDQWRWLAIGRNEADNRRLAGCATVEDLLLDPQDVTGPLALARGGASWPPALLAEAAGLAASYSPKAVRRGGSVCLHATQPGFPPAEIVVHPLRCKAWTLPDWETVHAAIRAEARKRLTGKLFSSKT